jgi:hypothetical protein
MKKTATLLALLLHISYLTFAQSPITLTQSNFGTLSTYPENVYTTWNPSTFNPSNHIYDASMDSSTPNGNVVYNTTTDAFFLGKTNSYATTNYAIAPGLSYAVDLYFYTGVSSFGQNAIGIARQGFPLVTVTGGATDSLFILAQKTILPVGREILHFPASYPYHNNIKSRRAVDFELSVAASGLVHTPGQHVKTIVRNDTMIDYGKLRIYTPAGPSAYYDILMLKSWQYETDSFYVGGSPAPTALTTAFGLKQGQITNVSNRYYVYRAGTAVPMMLFLADSSFAVFSNLFYDASIPAAPASGIVEIDQASYTSLVFPNPSHSSEIKVMIVGKTLDYVDYTITDMMGRVVQTAHAQEMHTGTLTVELDPQLSNGNYILAVTDHLQHIIAKEQIALAK